MVHNVSFVSVVNLSERYGPRKGFRSPNADWSDSDDAEMSSNADDNSLIAFKDEIEGAK